ncbi:aminotransferase class V-fold PLP-dependent enzyme [Francisella tularensis]|uniref:aminotransferase class V-fold PLP-dependent enzyme n=1 Tax=Francisella tularensis TaxID=263 RepID=UPI000173E4D1|nr:SufS family cysteine desulfurase [Francisella tularensis]ACD31123.1 selenocysteine lyase [Francisella tularensis subsp. mediasiatica FSC147]MBK2077433.1 SufS family cysteine desulfurase [Francisella tularensis subsp. mediasiatica]MBK2102306.1 SufS family cysteine desulfurase [Francisella tularensis subsp. mediasiatica]MBK2104707.1 SufS family cysteine desulfurase [Francisella tularensis subsp. mediasiatica]MDN9003872.1 SufS family cysteine desulfurase [Francisella tularensis subsp. mediasia
MYDVNKIRQDFPFLAQKINNKSVLFFDTGASAQKPQAVIECVAEAYAYNYANVHRGVYSLSQEASEKYENVRQIVQKFLNSKSADEIVITKGTTEAINLVASSIGKGIIRSDDEIVVTEMEHHANFVPWQMLCEDKNLDFKVAAVKDNGELDVDNLLALVTAKTKILAITLCSNVLGTINPMKEIIKQVREINPNIIVLVDGAQAVIHTKVDVQDLDCDFFVFSGHKLYGPTGVGILYGKYELLKQLPPYNYGGDMVDEVTIAKTTFALPPYRFEAGTPNIVEAIGLGRAIEYVDSIGMINIEKHEQKLLEYATAELNKIDGLTIFGQAKHKAGVITFDIQGCNAGDIGELLAIKGICVRTGKHCAHPLMYRMGVTSTVRMSLGMYNTFEEIDLFIIALKKVISQLK